MRDLLEGSVIFCYYNIPTGIRMALAIGNTTVMRNQLGARLYDVVSTSVFFAGFELFLLNPPKRIDNSQVIWRFTKIF